MLFVVALSLAAPEITRTRDVIYGRKYGLALTMDVVAPRKGNGLGVVFVVSAGWHSEPEAINLAYVASLLTRGYTAFFVIHGSRPKFTILEAVEDVHRAVRFVKHNAKAYRIDPDRLGAMGVSAGGHLALMMGTAGGPGDPKAKDPIDRLSSKVAAAGCFFPPTDLLNYGATGREMIDRAFGPPFTAAFDWREYDAKKALFVPIKDREKLRAIAKRLSPAWHVSRSSAPTLLIHGDADELVPLQQAERFCARLKEAGVAHKLEVRKGVGHGWATMPLDLDLFTDWFDEHLAGKKPGS